MTLSRLWGTALWLATAGCALESSVQGEAPTPLSRGTSGTCAEPVDLVREGVREGGALVFRGTTLDRVNALHPHDRCVAEDGGEVVFLYRVPAGGRPVRISTEGSRLDTVLYVRDHCAQVMGGADLACNNDSYAHAPQSELYLAPQVEGTVLFLVVDTNASETDAGGAFVLSVRDAPMGDRGQLCRPYVEGDASPRCEGALRCSEGGSADGSDLCVPLAGSGQACDPRRFDNLCDGETRCAVDPTPQRGVREVTVCAPPGTHAGAACRASDPRCDGALVCGEGREPICVRVLAPNDVCDVDQEVNRCPTGTACGTLRPDGDTVCHA